MKEKNKRKFSKFIQDYDLLVDEPLKKHTSFKIGGPADFLALPKDIDELKNLLKKANDLEIPISIFGGGTNLLVSDKGIRGLVVITKLLKSRPSIMETGFSKKTIYAEAGERLSKICQFAVDQSLSGLEFAAGIPGTIGGAIKMNAGTASGSMSGIVESIDVLNRTSLEIETIESKDLNFSYRQLTLSGIIIAATLILETGNLTNIKELFQENIKQKNATQPVPHTSAGCFFKNPDKGKTAGELIEKSGLKGTKVNDAMVSKKHANFIVNINNATCKDILSLKQKIQEIVFKKYQINLEAEVRVEGE